MSTTPEALPGTRPNGQGLIQRADEPRNSTAARHMILIDQLIAWACANPGKKWSAAAPVFQVSELWIRMIASSDAFKARYRTVQDELIAEAGIGSLKDKINAAAEMAVERLAEKIPTIESVGDLTDATEMLLGTIYGKAGVAAPSSNPTINVNTQVILEAREAIVSGANAPAPLPAPTQGEQK